MPASTKTILFTNYIHRRDSIPSQIMPAPSHSVRQFQSFFVPQRLMFKSIKSYAALVRELKRTCAATPHMLECAEAAWQDYMYFVGTGHANTSANAFKALCEGRSKRKAAPNAPKVVYANEHWTVTEKEMICTGGPLKGRHIPSTHLGTPMDHKGIPVGRMIMMASEKCGQCPILTAEAVAAAAAAVNLKLPYDPSLSGDIAYNLKREAEQAAKPVQTQASPAPVDKPQPQKSTVFGIKTMRPSDVREHLIDRLTNLPGTPLVDPTRHGLRKGAAETLRVFTRWSGDKSVVQMLAYLRTRQALAYKSRTELHSAAIVAGGKDVLTGDTAERYKFAVGYFGGVILTCVSLTNDILLIDDDSPETTGEAAAIAASKNDGTVLAQFAEQKAT
jgi:hypothetical protein